MSRVALWGSVGLAGGLVVAGGLGLARHVVAFVGDSPAGTIPEDSEPEAAALAPAPVTWSPSPPDPAAPGGPLRFIALGGGFSPDSNEVSLEQDIELIQRTLPGPGQVLFAGGSGSSPSVRELDPVPRGDPLELALGELILPREGRDSHYRSARFEAAPATEPNVQAALTAALAAGGPPLLLYIAAHGSRGNQPKENAVALWGEGELSVVQLAELHDEKPRPLRLVVTSCYSGGFADLAFWHAEAHVGLRARAPRCGVFAGTSDRATSGCDPNPDRRAQESYGLHMAHALSGSRRDDTPLPEFADFDHDGTFGLLDAHTWARIEANSVDVPTTTSERWLERHAVPGRAAIDPLLLPEDMAVVERLGAALGLSDEPAARSRWTALHEEIDALGDQVNDAEAQVDMDTDAERAAVLERWPVLDDPLHPDFDVTLSENREAVEQLLSSSPEAQARTASKERRRVLHARLSHAWVSEARVFRVVRAYDTLHRAAALMKSGGASARYYQALLACERAGL